MNQTNGTNSGPTLTTGGTEPSPAPLAATSGVGVAEGGGVDDDPIITTDMIRAQDQARIEELEEVIAEAIDYFINDEPLADDSPAGYLVASMRIALAKGKK